MAGFWYAPAMQPPKKYVRPWGSGNQLSGNVSFVPIFCKKNSSAAPNWFFIGNMLQPVPVQVLGEVEVAKVPWDAWEIQELVLEHESSVHPMPTSELLHG